MSIFDKIGNRKVCTTTPQVRSNHHFDVLNSFPTSVCQPEIYKKLRESIPVIDTAIYKLVRLTGGFTVKSNNEKNQAQLDDFVKNINTGVAGRGLQQFIDLYFEQLLTFGTAAGEIIKIDSRTISLTLSTDIYLPYSKGGSEGHKIFDRIATFLLYTEKLPITKAICYDANYDSTCQAIIVRTNFTLSSIIPA